MSERSRNIQNKSGFFEGCCVKPISIIWISIVFFIFITIIIFVCCALMVLTRWLYKRRIRRKKEEQRLAIKEEAEKAQLELRRKKEMELEIMVKSRLNDSDPHRLRSTRNFNSTSPFQLPQQIIVEARCPCKNCEKNINNSNLNENNNRLKQLQPTYTNSNVSSKKIINYNSESKKLGKKEQQSKDPILVKVQGTKEQGYPDSIEKISQSTQVSNDLVTENNLNNKKVYSITPSLVQETNNTRKKCNNVLKSNKKSYKKSNGSSSSLKKRIKKSNERIKKSKNDSSSIKTNTNSKSMKHNRRHRGSKYSNKNCSSKSSTRKFRKHDKKSKTANNINKPDGISSGLIAAIVSRLASRPPFIKESSNDNSSSIINNNDLGFNDSSTIYSKEINVNYGGDLSIHQNKSLFNPHFNKSEEINPQNECSSLEACMTPQRVSDVQAEIKQKIPTEGDSFNCLTSDLQNKESDIIDKKNIKNNNFSIQCSSSDKVAISSLLNAPPSDSFFRPDCYWRSQTEKRAEIDQKRSPNTGRLKHLVVHSEENTLWIPSNNRRDIERIKREQEALRLNGTPIDYFPLSNPSLNYGPFLKQMNIENDIQQNSIKSFSQPLQSKNINLAQSRNA